jgi:hypothetical protein
MKSTLISIAGAVIGGTLGYFAFFWILAQGYYGIILPGGLLGIGAGLGKPRSVWLAAAFGLAALGLGLFTEWQYRPFRENDGFVFFMTHLTDKPLFKLLMIAAGGALGFWIPFRRVERR